MAAGSLASLVTLWQQRKHLLSLTWRQQLSLPLFKPPVFRSGPSRPIYLLHLLSSPPCIFFPLWHENHSVLCLQSLPGRKSVAAKAGRGMAWQHVCWRAGLWHGRHGVTHATDTHAIPHSGWWREKRKYNLLPHILSFLLLWFIHR